MPIVVATSSEAYWAGDCTLTASLIGVCELQEIEDYKPPPRHKFLRTETNQLKHAGA